MTPANEAGLVPWPEYLSPADRADGYRKLYPRGVLAFARQREILRRVIVATRPGSVACLGAGALHDIPYRMLVRDGVEIHLADWQAEAMETGLAETITRAVAGGPPACLYCSLSDEDARRYCRKFRPPRDAAEKRCAAFVPEPAEAAHCREYVRGAAPQVHVADVTGGYANAFAERLAEILVDAESWRQALGRARAAVKAARKASRPLAIADGTIDLVTSAMLVSQFEHEPYSYFSRQTRRRLGEPRAAEETKLQASMEVLRDELLLRQVERHCDEILRILKPGGRCFMSFEMFHFDRDAGRWFLVAPMHNALAIIAERFRFDFDMLGDDGAMALFEHGPRRSMVQCFVLERG